MNKREYIQANKDWLEAKSKEEGVKALPKGIYYKVLSEGFFPFVKTIPTALMSSDNSINDLFGCKESKIPDNNQRSLMKYYDCFS